MERMEELVSDGNQLAWGRSVVFDWRAWWDSVFSFSDLSFSWHHFDLKLSGAKQYSKTTWTGRYVSKFPCPRLKNKTNRGYWCDWYPSVEFITGPSQFPLYSEHLCSSCQYFIDTNPCDFFFFPLHIPSSFFKTLSLMRNVWISSHYINLLIITMSRQADDVQHFFETVLLLFYQ